MSGPPEMNRPLDMVKRRPSHFDDDTPCICERDNPFLAANKQGISQLFFQVGDLFAERGLANT
jgi:hypothetical protein